MSSKKVLLIILIIALGIVVAVSAINIFLLTKDNNDSNRLYDKTNEIYVTQRPAVPEKTEATIDEQIPEWYETASVDLLALKEQNPEIVGYLYFENEDIRYPILYSGDNDKYLRTTYDGQSATAGSIFLEGKNNPNLLDAHTIIYGHNMRNLSMFGKLKLYKTEENYFNDHRYFMIFSQDRVRRYEIISFKDVDQNDDLYTVFDVPTDEFYGFIGKSIIEGGMPQVKQIVTLSTCSLSDSLRFVVNAVMIDEHMYE